MQYWIKAVLFKTEQVQYTLIEYFRYIKIILYDNNGAIFPIVSMTIEANVKNLSKTVGVSTHMLKNCGC